MCIICAAIPATAAVGAKLNVDQLNQAQEPRKPVFEMTGITIGLLVIASIIYHAVTWQR